MCFLSVRAGRATEYCQDNNRFAGGRHFTNYRYLYCIFITGNPLVFPIVVPACLWQMQPKCARIAGWQHLLVLVCLASILLGLSVVALSSAPPPRPFRLQRLDHVVLKCQDFNAMFRFYTEILGCTIDHIDDVGRFGGALTHLRAGDQTMIDLLSLDPDQLTEEGQEHVLDMLQQKPSISTSLSSSSSSSSSLPVIADASSSRLDHFCLRIEPFDQDDLMEYFQTIHGIEIMSTGLRKGAEGIGPSLYIQDPEGNVIELKGPSIEESSHAMNTSTENVSLNRTDDINTFTEKLPSSVVDASTENDTHDERVEDISSPKTDSTLSTAATEVPTTPCTRICRYNADCYDGQVCIGCFREAYEIGTWASMTDMEKAYALLDAADRSSVQDFEGSITKDELLRQAKHWQDRSKQQL